MKLTSIEKTVIGIIAALMIFVFYAVYTINREIEQAGGFSAIVIDAGKDIKAIAREINKD